MKLSELGPALSLELPPLKADNSSPWFVQFVVGVCGWFAGLLILVVVAITMGDFLRMSVSGLIPLGGLGCAIAAGLYSAGGRLGPFAGQFALALSFAGQAALGIGIGADSRSLTVVCFGMFVVELVLVVIMRNGFHRFLSTLAAVSAWALAMRGVLLNDIAKSAASAPTGGGLFVSLILWLIVWAPVAFAAWWLVRHEGQWIGEGNSAVLRPVTAGLIAALSVGPMALHPAAFWNEFQSSRGGAVDPWTALWPLLAVLLALFALWLAFTVRNHALMGAAILFGLLQLSGFYYVLGTTLLIKSMLMLAIGAVLFAAARGLEERKI